tara:strand:+ start:2901 stop:3290 length:390 start_codon:yes stop_codon:yes gene_type:complete
MTNTTNTTTANITTPETQVSGIVKYWSNYIMRMAVDRGWWEAGQLVCANPKMWGWIVTSCDDEEYLAESIYSALTNPEPLLAYRAVIQATCVMERCTNKQLLLAGQLADAYRTAVSRVEEMLPAPNRNR